jgi:outer membrane protein assembly complex protein YaeT
MLSMPPFWCKLPVVVALFCVVWAHAGPAWGQADGFASEEETRRIGAVRLVGLEAISAASAQEVVETKPPPIFSLLQGPLLDLPQLERDRLRLVQLYQDIGYFGTQISYEIEPHPSGTVTVEFRVRENQPSLVREVKVELPSVQDEEIWGARLRARLTLVTGEPFSLRRYEQDKAALGQLLADDAHPKHRIDGQVRVHPHEWRVEIVLQVEPGPRVFFGSVDVTGQDRRDLGFILRQMPFVRGQPFSQTELTKARRALLDTGFYSSVNLTPDFEHLEKGQSPILVEVKEAKRHSVRLGLGWGNEDQFRLRILQVNRDMLGLNDTLSFEGKTSHIYQGLIGRLRLPELPSRLIDTLMVGGVEQNDNEAFINRRYFLIPILEYRLQQRWSWFLGYNVEKDRMVELKTAVPDPERERQQIYISSLPLGLKYDSRDNLLDPKRGVFFRVEAEAASDAIGSEVAFFRPQADLRQVLPVTFLPGWYLASRAKAGLAYPLPGTERIPMVRRFFPGGADSVRGYAYQSLGHLDSAGKPLGGEAMAEASVELRFPLWGGLGGVAFVDAGNAYENISTEMGALRFTAGAGLRYQTPVGPIRLDFGYQLNPPDHSLLSRYEFYLSVGQAF